VISFKVAGINKRAASVFWTGMSSIECKKYFFGTGKRALSRNKLKKKNCQPSIVVVGLIYFVCRRDNVIVEAAVAAAAASAVTLVL